MSVDSISKARSIYEAFKQSKDNPLDHYNEVPIECVGITGKVRDFCKFGEKYPTVEYSLEVLHELGFYNSFSYDAIVDNKTITLIVLPSGRAVDVNNITPEEKEQYAAYQKERLENADLSYPILLVADDNGDILTLLDGGHRITKAVNLGHKTIKAKIIPSRDLYNYFDIYRLS